MICTSVYGKNIAAFNRKKRFIINQGGQSSSKTYSILQLLINIALRASGNRWISIVSETLPHLKKGAMRDFVNILEGEWLYSDNIHNKTDHIFTIYSACGRYTTQVEFFGADSSDKVRGPRRDYLYINECNNVSYEVYYHLSSRTRRAIFLDFNPVQEFWCHTQVIPELNSDEMEFIKSTYLDNEQLSEAERKDIERRAKIDPYFRRVFAEGEVGVLDGLIFPGINIVEAMPTTDKRRIGIDFGFTNDPTAIIDVRLNDGELWLDEVTYEKGLLNSVIADRCKALALPRGVDIIPDSSEPKSIEEMRLYGLPVRGAVKGEDSIRSGIQLMQQYRINVTKRSTNLIKELRVYQWAKDKNGTPTNKPVGGYDHAIDAARYAITDLLNHKPLKSPRFHFG